MFITLLWASQGCCSLHRTRAHPALSCGFNSDLQPLHSASKQIQSPKEPAWRSLGARFLKSKWLKVATLVHIKAFSGLSIHLQSSPLWGARIRAIEPKAVAKNPGWSNGHPSDLLKVFHIKLFHHSYHIEVLCLQSCETTENISEQIKMWWWCQRKVQKEREKRTLVFKYLLSEATFVLNEKKTHITFCWRD